MILEAMSVPIAEEQRCPKIKVDTACYALDFPHARSEYVRQNVVVSRIGERIIRYYAVTGIKSARWE